jgi:hypothetical protein
MDRPIGPAEAKIIEWIRIRGPSSAKDLKGLASDPYRILVKLARLGLLTRLHHGYYTIPKSTQERIAETRKHQASVRASLRAPNGVPSQSVKKGAPLAVDTVQPFPGDLVLVSKGKTDHALTTFTGYDCAHGSTSAKAYVFVDHEGQTARADVPDVSLAVVLGCYCRCTVKATQTRAAEPKLPKPPPDSPLWWSPTPKGDG